MSKHFLVFMASVAEAEALADNLNRKGVSAAIVSSKTSKKDRADILKRFKNGDIRVVTNVGTLTTGFDFPELDTVILARPTQSVALHYQMCGRVIRVHPDKEVAHIIDLCGNVKRFGRLETFKIVENSPGMHRLESETSFLTGYDFYHNEDIEARGYKGMRESEFKGRADLMPFGKYKGTHVAKVPNDYLIWASKTFSGKIKDMVDKELLRRHK